MVSVRVVVIAASYGNQIQREGKVMAALHNLGAPRAGSTATGEPLVGQIVYPHILYYPHMYTYSKVHRSSLFL